MSYDSLIPRLHCSHPSSFYLPFAFTIIQKTSSLSAVYYSERERGRPGNEANSYQHCMISLILTLEPCSQDIYTYIENPRKSLETSPGYVVRRSWICWICSAKQPIEDTCMLYDQAVFAVCFWGTKLLIQLVS